MIFVCFNVYVVCCHCQNNSEMAGTNDITKYFKEVPDKSGVSIGFRQLAKKEEQYEASISSKESVLSNLFTTSSAPDNGASFFDMLGSGNGDFALDTKSAEDKTHDGLSNRFTIPEKLIPKPGRVSDMERSRSAWIPLESTRKVLIAMVTSPPGSYHQDTDNLTMPGVVLEEDLKDTVTQALSHFLGPDEAAKRKVLLASDVTQDDHGLRILIKAGCYRAAVNLTKSLLTMYGQGPGRAGHPSKHTLHSIQLWHTRLALLVKLKCFMEAEIEAKPFGDLDRPDLFLQFYPELYGGRLGSLVPFSFRLLIAQIPMHVKKHQVCLEKLYKILAVVRKMLGNLEKGFLEDGTPCDLNPTSKEESLQIWRHRESLVLQSVVNCALSFEDYTLAIEVMNSLISKDLEPKEKNILHSALGRILLQLGDVRSAQRQFMTFKECADDTAEVKIRCLVDAGLLFVAENKFKEALAIFEQAAQLDPSNVMIISNISVCLLYLGCKDEAVQRLEDGIKSYPALALQESYIFNLCNLYELKSLQCQTSKLNLLAVIGKHRGDNVNISFLKLEP